jgi:hypothetical protein
VKIHVRIALAGFLLVATFFLLKEHHARILGALPWALLLLCPILHLFMHRGHRGHGSHESHGSRGTSHGSHRMDQGEGKE